MLLHGKNGDDTVPIQVDEDGIVAVSATVSPPEGGATEDKQDDTIALLGGGLPAALTAGGGLKVGLVDAVPAGTNTIGAVTAPAGAALATAAKQDAQTTALQSLDGKTPALGQALAAASVPVVLPAAQITSLQAPTAGQGTAAADSLPWPVKPVGGGSALFANAQALGGTLTTPTATVIGAVIAGYNSGLGRPIVIPVGSTGEPSVVAKRYPPTSRSGATTLQITRTFAAFSATPYALQVWTGRGGYLALFNKASAPVDGDVPYGGRVWAVDAGDNLQFEFHSRLQWGTGISVAHLSQVINPDTGVLDTKIGLVACILSELLFD